MKKLANAGNSLVVQWLGFRALTAEGLDSIPGQGTKIPLCVSLSVVSDSFTTTCNSFCFLEADFPGEALPYSFPPSAYLKSVSSSFSSL